LNGYSVGTDLATLRDYAMNSTDEWGRAFQYDPDNGWFGGSAGFISGNSNSVAVFYSCNTGATAHTHPSGSALSGPSAQDLATVISRSLSINSDVNGDCSDGSYLGEYIAAGVDGGTIVYFLYVADADKAASFFESNAAGINYIDPVTHNFEESSNIGTAYKEAYDEFNDRGYGDDAAHQYAFAYVLDSYNTGITLFQVSGNHFTPVLVDRDNSKPLLDQFSIKVILCNSINN
jgi:hypothetical protein